MKQVTQHNKTGEILLDEIPLPALKPGYILVKTRYSVISAGTEKASIAQRKSSLLQKAKKNPDLVFKVLEQVKQLGLLQTYRRVRTQLETFAALGYSASGVVLAVGAGVMDFKVGDRVACAGGGASHAEYLLVPNNLCVKLPKNVNLDEAAYCTLGAIAMQGVRQVEPTLGETIVVIGLGLVGQLTVQLLKANGCSVIGIDPDSTAVQLAKECGADLALHRNNDDVKNIIRSFTKGICADGVIITAATPSNDPIVLAGELCRDKGRVVLVGDVGIELPRAPYYMKELDFRLSRSYGAGRYDSNYEDRGNDYPIGYVRWTENRNMQEFLRLLSTKEINVKKLTTHTFTIDDAKAAYDMISGGKKKKREHYIGILLDYGDAGVSNLDELTHTVQLPKADLQPLPSSVPIGFLGAGNFAQGFLLPHLRNTSEATLLGVCTSNGLNAKNVARNFGFQFATTEPQEILGKDSMKAVFIAARHNHHAHYTVDALNAGKHVFVEKPLALTIEELKGIKKTYNSLPKPAIVMVGFNRRFAPHAQQVKRFFENAAGPYVMNYRVNAGFISKTHWVRDPVEGGGRIIGEMCHFIDLMQFVTGSLPTKVFAEPLSIGGASSQDDDSVTITIKFHDGSIGTIMYIANGDSSVPKERLEVSSTGRTAVIDNFQALSLYQQGKRRDFKFSAIEKGHREEVKAFLHAIQNGAPSPIAFESMLATTFATFKIVESLQVGASVSL
ncbi:MAG: bi-domain-containing oxidoreductase [Ignavibacteriales bacterium]|nr:bi-domain-containing oxidoreductase [Ignavibacteriales bacterium]